MRTDNEIKLSKKIQMKKILLFSLLLLIVATSRAQDTIYSIAYTPSAIRSFDLNDRDTGNYFSINPSQANNLWKIGTPSKSTFTSAYSVPLALVTDTLNPYPDNNTSSFSFTVFSDDLTFISFWHRINTDSLNDGGVVEFSTDGGLTWKNILNSSYTLTNFYSSSSKIASNSNQPGFTGTSGWTQATIEGIAFKYVKFRFTFSSDNKTSVKDGWMVDDLQINCLGTGIKRLEAVSSISLFPNPTSGLISINFAQAQEIISLTVRDITGRIISTSTNKSLDLSALNYGFYFIDLITTKGRFVKQIQKK